MWKLLPLHFHHVPLQRYYTEMVNGGYVHVYFFIELCHKDTYTSQLSEERAHIKKECGLKS